MQELKFFEYAYCNGCDELLDYMVRNYGKPHQGYIDFQGDEIEVGGFMPDTNVGTVIVISPKYEGVVFLIGKENSSLKDGHFLLSIINEYGVIDQMPGVLVPNYCREELIFTARGLW